MSKYSPDSVEYPMDIHAMMTLSNRLRSALHGQTLADLLDHFESFVRDYHDFIEQHSPERERGRNLNRAVNRLQFEWATISRASEQRRLEEFHQELSKADAELQKYYQAFKGYKYNVVPVVYFEKLYAIRRFIFTQYPLVSIPLRYYGDPKSFAALAHELGHYIYWNCSDIFSYHNIHVNLTERVSEAVREGVRAEMSAMPQIAPGFDPVEMLATIWSAWAEELFADICGTMFTGRAFFLSTLERMEVETGLNAQELLENDEDHPCHYVRPLIAVETIAWLAGRAQKSGAEAVEDLRQQWQDVINGVEKLDEVLITAQPLDVETTRAFLKLMQRSAAFAVRAVLDMGDGWVPSDQGIVFGDLFDVSLWLPKVKGLADTQEFVQLNANMVPGELNHSFDFLLDAVGYIAGNVENIGDVVFKLLNYSLSDEEYGLTGKRRVVMGNGTFHSSGKEYQVENPAGNSLNTIPAGYTANGVPLFLAV